MWVILAFGVLGFLFERHQFPIAPLVLGTILGPLAETNFMTAMISYNNDWTIFFTRPVSGVIMGLAALTLAYPAFAWGRAHLRRRLKAVDHADPHGA